MKGSIKGVSYTDYREKVNVVFQELVNWEVKVASAAKLLEPINMKIE